MKRQPPEKNFVNWDKNTFIPFHPGAVKYYEEKGIKIPANLKLK